VSLPAGRLEAALRTGPQPVIARVEDGCVVLDLRTVSLENDELLGHLVVRAASTLLP
jgi:seryl-tRNA(Sec) selenium transferase